MENAERGQLLFANRAVLPGMVALLLLLLLLVIGALIGISVMISIHVRIIVDRLLVQPITVR